MFFDNVEPQLVRIIAGVVIASMCSSTAQGLFQYQKRFSLIMWLGVVHAISYFVALLCGVYAARETGNNMYGLEVLVKAVLVQTICLTIDILGAFTGVV